MRRAAKVDSNQVHVVKLLRSVPGVTVAVTSRLGEGFPDLIIGYKGRNFLIELKDGDKFLSQQKLTKDEEKWHTTWKGQVAKCNSFDEIYNLIKKD